MKFQIRESYPQYAGQTFTGTYGGWEFVCENGLKFTMPVGVRGFGYNGEIVFDQNGVGKIFDVEESPIPSCDEQPRYIPTDEDILEAFGC